MNDQRHQNYVRIGQHVNELESCPLTEDRLEKYKRYFNEIRDHFPDLRLVNTDLQDRRFRAAAVQGETYMQLLEQEFDHKVYLQLLYVLKYMVECTFEEDELTKLMGCMTM